MKKLSSFILFLRLGNFVPLPLCAFVTFIMFFVIACEKPDELVSKANNLDEIADQESWNATITSTKNGLRTSKISYGHMQRYSSTRRVEFDSGVDIDFFDDSGKKVSVVRADSATMLEIENNVELNGNVVVNSVDGVNLKTEKLTWNEQKNRVHTEEFVTVITAKGDTINGTGYESNKAFTNWKIKKPWGVTQKKLKFDKDQ